ncbi:hypothetical protein [Chloroflexus sp.]|uniref:hypothetical protein n=1 Tax=Chloroflexus sp. TaxID=1904827 RepID=UPI002ADDF71F|nr:hypothetical protein [Chloroflexus sp.]
MRLFAYHLRCADGESLCPARVPSSTLARVLVCGALVMKQNIVKRLTIPSISYFLSPQIEIAAGAAAWLLHAK